MEGTRPLRRPRRLAGVDYAGCGTWFVTTVTAGRAPVFGAVDGTTMRLSPAGEAVHRAWAALPTRFPFVRLDEFIVMPNHLHGVLEFLPDDEVQGDRHPEAWSRVHLDVVVQAFKSLSAIEVNRLLGRTGRPVWQAGYFEHVVRDERGLDRIRAYIAGNPEAWPRDRYHA